MISKSQIKLITSLQQKKYRVKTGLFIAEGPKIIQDFLSSSLKLHSLYVTDFEENALENYPFLNDVSTEINEIPSIELQKVSSLKTANTMLALFQMPKAGPLVDQGLTLVLDAIRDPGNLGTIIRLCDWFGIKQLVCSPDSVDCYNPKVVQATMGSLARVEVIYTDLSEYIRESKRPIYTAVMSGEDVYKTQLSKDAILIMGNEANGVSQELLAMAPHVLTIPNFGNSETAESLNVAVATAILISEFRRSIEK